MAVTLTISMFAQIAYQLLSLYFIAGLGAAAVAGVNAAGSVIFIVNALLQVLVAGTIPLMAHAIGRRELQDANRIFNQSVALAAACAILTTSALLMFARPFMRSVAADAATLGAGILFIYWMLPGFALSFPMAAFSAALRGTGVVRPSVVAYTLSVVINAMLAPLLITGWGTGVPLGVQGAGLATSISVAIGTAVLAIYFRRSQRYMVVSAELIRPHFQQWRQILTVGLPAGGELAVTFLSTSIAYFAIRDFGASAQAGFGIGSRVLQVVLLPAIAIALPVAPIAGQNFGARNGRRVRETFHRAVVLQTLLMLSITIGVQWQLPKLIGQSSADPASLALAADFLRSMSWTFVPQGLVYTCSAMFQGLGHTTPALTSSGIGLLAFAVPAFWLSTQQHFRIEHLWYSLAASIVLHSLASLWLLHANLRRRLNALPPAGTLKVTHRDSSSRMQVIHPSE